MSKIVQRKLPLGIEYTLKSSWQTSLEAGICCDNCGACIANCAEVESEGRVFTVGMDCAKTLCGESLGVMQAESAFNQAKSARNRLRKAIKNNEGTNFQAVTYSDANNFWKEANAGRWEFTLPTGGAIYKSYPANVWKSHVLPMIQDLVKG